MAFNFGGFLMTGLVRSQYANLGAASVAAIVTLGLVTVPPTGDPLAVSLKRAESVAVQLQAQVSDFVQTATANAPATSATVGANVVSPAKVVASDTASPDPTTQFLQTVVFILALPLLVVTSPIWVPLGFIALLNLGLAFGRLDSHVPIQQGLPGWTVTSVVVGTPTVVGSAASVAGPAASLAPTTGSTPTAKARYGQRDFGSPRKLDASWHRHIHCRRPFAGCEFGRRSEPAIRSASSRQISAWPLATRFNPNEADIAERMLREYGGTILDRQLLSKIGLVQ